jgi:glutamate-1-semialdehyde 2,1-aminomutase
MTNLYTHTLIPGGAHTYSKGDDQFPANAPSHIERGDGARVWDRDGTEYLDWCMGLRSMTLGYRYTPVIEAAIAQVWQGSNFGRPSYVETELAEDISALIPSAEMVKFAKNGSTVTTAAVKLARAYTGRDLVAVCKDHPFFSYDDWFIGATAVPAGVPQAIRDLTLTFRYNDLASLQALFDAHPREIACVIMEPATTEEPAEGFLQGVADLCRTNGAVFVLDEMITGFRYHLNGAQTLYGVTPDLATFGKGMGNGFSVAALVGRREIMELGGLFHGKPRVFLISTTHGAENHSLAAARAVIRTFREQPVIDHMWRIGGLLMQGLNEAARSAGVAGHFKAFGFPCNPGYTVTDETGAASPGLRTLFMQEMVKAGILIPYIAPALAHSEADVARTVEAAQAALRMVARGLDGGWQKLLDGPPVKPVFREFN